ncbi:MAG: hypothetical protein ACOX0P_03305 [Candidatus Dojkabacteria bacterium]|jgi:hypothetical protein
MKLKSNFDIKRFVGYLSLVIATSFGITAILIALPLTEKISERTSFDLITKENQYWSREYVLELQTTDTKDIEKVRNIIYKRLKKFKVEQIEIAKLKELSDTGNTTLLKVTINTTRDPNLVKELIANQFQVRIVTKKEDIDFFDEENQFAHLFAENYDPTGWDRSNFRNVHITELKTTNNTYSYFAIFKPWVSKQADFNKLLDEHKGEYMGIDTDGFVTPYLVPLEEQSVFAIPLSYQYEEEVEAIDILYNSGIISTNYTLLSETDLDPHIIKINHIGISGGFAISLLLTYLLLVLLKHDTIDDVKRAFLASILTISVYLAFLKLFNIPVDTFLLPIIAILIFLLIKTLVVNLDSVFYIEIGLILLFLIVKILGYGYIEILANHLIWLVVLSKLTLISSGWYLDKIKEV